MWFIPLKDESVLCAEIPELFLFTGRVCSVVAWASALLPLS